MDPETKKMVYGIIERRLAELIESVDSFNTRAGLVLATCGVVFTGYATLLTSDRWLRRCGSELFIFEVGLAMLAGVLAFMSLAPGADEEQWRNDPDPEKLYRLLEAKDGKDVLDEAARSMVDAYNQNKRIMEKKFSLLRGAKYALYASGGIFFIHLMIFLF